MKTRKEGKKSGEGERKKVKVPNPNPMLDEEEEEEEGRTGEVTCELARSLLPLLMVKQADR